MAKEVEKKYRVNSFTPILDKIYELGAIPTIEVSSQHYYAPLDTDDTLKMIDYGDKIEIHNLSTKNGLHTLDEVIAIRSIKDGLKWFEAKGFKTLEVLDMNDKEFSYKDGGFALYTINNNIYSVIIAYPENKLSEIETILGLQAAEIITIPYNKYMRQKGMVRTISTY